MARQMKLEERLRLREPLLLDGAMRTELDRLGAAGRCECNARSPGAVTEVHAHYFAAGSHAAITNTLTMNRPFIETHGIGVDVAEASGSQERQ